MSIIHCINDCVYQNEGYCQLKNAANVTSSQADVRCAHYKSRENDKESKKKIIQANILIHIHNIYC